MADPGSSDFLKSNKEKICRVVVQQCTQAELRSDTGHPPVSIKRGIVVYVCFLQGATPACIEPIARSILQARLSEPDDDTPSRKSAIELEACDVLLVPQATLGGKLKGKNVQYHGIVAKATGAELFKDLVDTMNQFLQAQDPQKSNVRAGIYGARQILCMDTNGPYTHVFDY